MRVLATRRWFPMQPLSSIASRALSALGLAAGCTLALSGQIRAGELALTVRPSPGEVQTAPDPAQSAAERIRRRLERTDSLLRSICTGCSREAAAFGQATGGAFSPTATLQGRTPAAERTLTETRTVVEYEVELTPGQASGDGAPSDTGPTGAPPRFDPPLPPR